MSAYEIRQCIFSEGGVLYEVFTVNWEHPIDDVKLWIRDERDRTEELGECNLPDIRRAIGVLMSKREEGAP